MSYIDQAARVTGPISAADTSGRTGVMRLALTGSAQTFTLPTASKAHDKKHALAGRFITMYADGDSIQWAFGKGAAPTIVRDQVSVVSTGHVSAGATLVNGVPRSFLIPNDCTHVGLISKTASPPTSYLEWYVSDKPVL